jgi:hypothetical protein
MTDFDSLLAIGPARVTLAERSNAGVHVSLVWAEKTNAVAVLVHDDTTDDRFELAVESGVSALDVFQHPYAYAAWRGVDYGADDLRLAA